MLRRWELPADAGAAQDRWFRRTLAISLFVAAVVSTGLARLPVPEADRLPPPGEPERLARLLPPPVEVPEPEPLPEPAPPPVPAEPEPEPEPVVTEPEPEPVEVAEAAPEPPSRPDPEPEPEPAPRPDPEPPPGPTPEELERLAREEAEAAGLMAVADQLASLRANDALGSARSAEVRRGVDSPDERTERDVLALRAADRSEGVRDAPVSRDAAGAGLGERDTTEVVSTLAGNRPGAGGSGPGGPAGAGGGDDGALAARTREEVERVFDRNKGAIYALYDRALRQDPTLSGRLVVRLTIEPSGEISDAEIVSSELDDTELERRLLQRIRLFRFEARDVARAVTTKPIEFFPA